MHALEHSVLIMDTAGLASSFENMAATPKLELGKQSTVSPCSFCIVANGLVLW